MSGKAPPPVDERTLSERFIHASGPGGQNVNKVASAVQLSCDTGLIDDLSDAARARLRHLAGRRMRADGVIVITARRFRDQDKNRKDARARLAALLAKARIEPPKRRPTRPGPAARRRRLAAKQHLSRRKQNRRRPASDDD